MTAARASVRLIKLSGTVCPTDKSLDLQSPNKAGDVVQLVRTLPCHGRGREFESRRPRQLFQQLTEIRGDTTNRHQTSPKTERFTTRLRRGARSGRSRVLKSLHFRFNISSTALTQLPPRHAYKSSIHCGPAARCSVKYRASK